MNKQEELFDVERKQIALNVVGKIDLGDTNGKAHAGQCVSHAAQADYIISTPTREEIEKKVAAWQPDWKFMRATAQCGSINAYNDGDVLQFRHNGVSGIAIGCLDPLRQTAGYYIAVGLYGEHAITKRSEDEMPDGVKAGEWPVGMSHINKASPTQIQMAETFLVPQIENERKAFRECLVQEFMELAEEQARRAEEERKRQEEAERERQKQEAIQRLEDEKARLAEEDRREREDVLPEFDMAHLPLSRREKTLRNYGWPRVDQEIDEQRYFSAMGVLASVFEFPCNTYVMSRTYVNFLYVSMKEQCKEFSTVRNLIGEGENRRAVLCLTKRLGGEVRDVTIPYVIGSHAKNGTDYIRFAIIVDGQMYGTYVHTRKNAAVQPFVTHISLLSGTDPDYQCFNMKDMCAAVITLILSHVMMEQQTEALTNDNDDDNDNKATVLNGSPLGDDIILRTAAWYNSVTVPATEVASYESHRWKGSGENKTLEPVTVSGYTKGAYTRQAQCEK